jgi:hypothetical protein
MRQLIGETLLSGPAAALTARRKVIQVLTCLDRSPTFVAPLAGTTSELVRQLVANGAAATAGVAGAARAGVVARSRLMPLLPPSRTAANHVVSGW